MSEHRMWRTAIAISGHDRTRWHVYAYGGDYIAQGEPYSKTGVTENDLHIAFRQCTEWCSGQNQREQACMEIVKRAQDGLQQ